MLKRCFSLFLALILLSTFLLSKDIDGDQYEGRGVQITSLDAVTSASSADSSPAFIPLHGSNSVVEFDVVFIPVAKKSPVVPLLVTTLPLLPGIAPILVTQEARVCQMEARGPPRTCFLFSPLGLRAPPFAA